MNPAAPPPPPIYQLAANLPCWQANDGTFGIEIGTFQTDAGTSYKHLRTRDHAGRPHDRYFRVNNLQPAQLHQCDNIPRQAGLVMVRQNAVPMGGRHRASRYRASRYRASRNNRKHRTRRHRKNWTTFFLSSNKYRDNIMGHFFSKQRQYRTGEELGLYPKQSITIYPSREVAPVKCPTCHSYTHIHEWIDSDNKQHRVFLCHSCIRQDSMMKQRQRNT